MQMDMQDFKLQVDELWVSEDAGNRLDVFCAALIEMKANGQSPDTDAIMGGLSALTALLQPESERGSSTNWTAIFTKSPYGNGGGIALENKSTRQHLTVSVDRKGAFYNGTWARYVSDNQVEGAMFELEERAEGYGFEIMDGAITRTCMLGASLGGMVWTAASAVEEVLPDWLARNKVKRSKAAQQPPIKQTKMNDKPAADIPVPVLGDILPKPEQNNGKSEPSAGGTKEVSGQKDSQTKMCPACGGKVKQTAKFCPACGFKLSAENKVAADAQTSKQQAELSLNNQIGAAIGTPTVQEIIPPLKKLCRKCGRPLGPGARFCNGCGTSV